PSGNAPPRGRRARPVTQSPSSFHGAWGSVTWPPSAAVTACRAATLVRSPPARSRARTLEGAAYKPGSLSGVPLATELTTPRRNHTQSPSPAAAPAVRAAICAKLAPTSLKPPAAFRMFGLVRPAPPPGVERGG